MSTSKGFQNLSPSIYSPVERRLKVVDDGSTDAVQNAQFLLLLGVHNCRRHTRRRSPKHFLRKYIAGYVAGCARGSRRVAGWTRRHCGGTTTLTGAGAGAHAAAAERPTTLPPTRRAHCRSHADLSAL
jgi:hypothetical protein